MIHVYKNIQLTDTSYSRYGFDVTCRQRELCKYGTGFTRQDSFDRRSYKSETHYINIIPFFANRSESKKQKTKQNKKTQFNNQTVPTKKKKKVYFNNIQLTETKCGVSYILSFNTAILFELDERVKFCWSEVRCEGRVMNTVQD